MTINPSSNTINIENQIRTLEREVSYDVKEYTVEVLIRKFALKDIFVPTFQRNYIWPEKVASKFIESVILGIPIPFLFCADTEEGVLEIIDGVQRVTTLHRFVNNEIALNGLDKLTLFKDMYFRDLPLAYQKRFLNRSIRVIVLNEATTSETRMDLFHRINTGSKQLTSAELRKGLSYNGPFYNFLGICADNKDFIELCPLGESKKKREEDFELILRFFAFSEMYKKFDSNTASFLDKYLAEKNKGFDKDAKDKEFKNMLAFVKKNIPMGFRKTKNAKSTPRVRFEALSIGINLALLASPHSTSVPMEPLLHSKEFLFATTSDASNLKKKLEYRIELVRDYILTGKIRPMPSN